MGRAMAELPPEAKNRISHRARALRALRPEITERLTGA
jgi:inosine/xanthosine triphosphate pyrophosphatase family protein